MAGIGNFLSGMAQGYGTVMRFSRDAEEDKWRREERERARKEREREESIRRDLEEASAPARFSAVDIQPSVPSDDDGNAMPSVRAGMVNGNTYEISQAEDARRAYDDPMAVTLRQAGVYAKHGRPERAVALQNTARQGEVQRQQLDLSRQQLAASQQQLAEREREAAAKRFQLAVVNAYWQGGPEGYARLFNDEYQDGVTYSASDFNQETGGFRLTGTDQQGNRRAMTFGTYADAIDYARSRGEPDKFIARSDARADRSQAQANWQAGHDETVRFHNAAIANQQGHLGVARQNAESRAERDSGGSGATSQRMPPDVAASLKSIDERIKMIQTEQAKAMAGDPGWRPDSRGNQALTVELRVLEQQRRTLLSQYQGGAPATRDAGAPAGGAPAPRERVPADEQRARDIDALGMKRRELEAAKDPATREALQREIARMEHALAAAGFAAPPGSAPVAAPPAAAPPAGQRPVSARDARMSTVVAQQGAQQPPQAIALDAARARTAAARQRLSSYGSRQRQADPQGYDQAGAELVQAIAAERDAFAAYQASVGGVGAAHRYAAP